MERPTPRRICPECETSSDQPYCPQCGSPSFLVFATSGPQDALVGKVFNERFRIDAPLGRGGMGTVYKAMQLGMERVVAIKVIRHELASDLEAVRRFFREVKAASLITHHHAIQVFDHGQAETGELYLSMEYLDGRSLDTVLGDEGQLPWERAARIASEIAEALAEAHVRGLAHRDLKPANVMLLERVGHPDFVKVLDFGIAKFLHMDSWEGQVTRTGAMMGTPHYMAPDQARAARLGERLTTAIDVYALGVLLFEMLAGHRPFDGETPVDVLLAHVVRPVPELPAECDAPQALRLLVRAMLQKDPRQRPPAPALITAIHSVLRQGGGAVRTTRPTSPGIPRMASSTSIPRAATSPVLPRAANPSPRSLPTPTGAISQVAPTGPAPSPPIAAPPVLRQERPSGGTMMLPEAERPPAPPSATPARPDKKARQGARYVPWLLVGTVAVAALLLFVFMPSPAPEPAVEASSPPSAASGTHAPSPPPLPAGPEPATAEGAELAIAAGSGVASPPAAPDVVATPPDAGSAPDTTGADTHHAPDAAGTAGSVDAVEAVVPEKAPKPPRERPRRPPRAVVRPAPERPAPERPTPPPPRPDKPVAPASPGETRDYEMLDL